MIRTKDEIIGAEAAACTPKKILDIGYAQGPNLHLMKDGVEVYGVDLVDWPSPYTKNILCDLNTEALPFNDGEMDVVTMGCVLAHVAKPLALLADIHRVLKPNGVLILTSTNPNYYWESVLNLFYHSFKKKVSKSKHIEHFFEFNRYAMRTSLERAGFTLEKEIGSGFQMVKLGFKLMVERFPGLAYEIIYVARKTGTPRGFTIIEDAKWNVIELPTDLFS